MHLSSSICPDSLKQKCPLLPVSKKGYQAKGIAYLVGYQQYLLLVCTVSKNQICIFTFFLLCCLFSIITSLPSIFHWFISRSARLPSERMTNRPASSQTAACFPAPSTGVDGHPGREDFPALANYCMPVCMQVCVGECVWVGACALRAVRG